MFANLNEIVLEKQQILEKTDNLQPPAFLSVVIDEDQKNLSEEDLLLSQSFQINLSLNPELVELTKQFGFTQRGSTFIHSTTNDGDPQTILQFVTEYSKKFTIGTLFASSTFMKKKSVGELVWNRNRSRQNWFYYPGQSHIYSSLLVELSRISENQGNPIDLEEVDRHTVQYTNEDIQASSIVKDKYNQIFERVYRGRKTKENVRSINALLENHSESIERFLSPVAFHMYIKRGVLYMKPQNTFSANIKWMLKATEFLSKKDKTLSRTDINCLLQVDRWLQKEAPDQVNLPEFGRKSRNLSAMTTIGLIRTLSSVYPASIWDTNDKRALELLQSSSNKYIVTYEGGKPAKALISRGQTAPNIGGLRIFPEETLSIPLKEINELKEQYGDCVIVNKGLQDIRNMNTPKKYQNDKLATYQNESVALHLSTQVGYLNACEPGLGKSLIQLNAMRERSKNIKYYRGLIVCEANARQQWDEYTKEWFPEANVAIITQSNKIDEIVKVLSDEAPAIVYISYALASTVLEAQEYKENLQKAYAKAHTFKEMKEIQKEDAERKMTLGDVLLSQHWHDICADEAVCLRNTSKQTRAMWILRRNSDVAVPLTGTPINTTPDDMGRLLEWARNDKNLFQGHKLSAYANTLDGAIQLFKDLSPLVFRREKTEIEKDLANVKNKTLTFAKMNEPQSLLLTPQAAEISLANAAEKELRRVYTELVEAIEKTEKEQSRKGENTEELKKAKEELKKAHSQWLGGTQLARMATSDPATILDSNSVGASLLAGQGLVANALEHQPTKQKTIIQRVKQHIKKNEHVLVFTEFSRVAERLSIAFQNEGIRAATFTGKNLNQRDENRKKFQNDELDVLICTKAGERGLTLHNASAVYNYDLPWTADRLLQRIGRATRVGSKNAAVDVYFLILKDTIEERIAKKVLNDGTTASMILDASRGIDIAQTALGKTMKGLMKTSKTIASQKGAIEFGRAILMNA